MGSIRIVYVAFGDNYLTQCASSVRSLRKYDSYPVTVITNANNTHLFDSIPGVSLVVLPWESILNRHAKTQLHKFVANDLNFYVDSDTIFVHSCKELFENLDKEKSFWLYPHPYGPTVTNTDGWSKKLQKISRIYKVAPPLGFWMGCMLLFRGRDSKMLFEAWNDCWIRLGCQTDQTALSIAVASLPTHLVGTLSSNLVGVPRIIEGSVEYPKIVRHPGHHEFRHIDGIPKLKHNYSCLKKGLVTRALIQLKALEKT